MSFLDQLKSQANALQSQRSTQQQDLAGRIAQTEQACETTWRYFNELARQLNVIVPRGPTLSLDNRQAWPEMCLVDFRSDARKKFWMNREVYDHVSLGWVINPRDGKPQATSVSVNFPPDLERVTSRLALGQVRHERHEVRHPEKNSLLAFRFDYQTQAFGSVRATADHEAGEIHFRAANLRGFEVAQVRHPVQRINSVLLDELACLIVGQAGSFL